MEADAFLLMEMQGIPYADVMGMPYSRRQRFVDQKSDLERRRVAKQREAASRMRSGRRR